MTSGVDGSSDACMGGTSGGCLIDSSGACVDGSAIACLVGSCDACVGSSSDTCLVGSSGACAGTGWSTHAPSIGVCRTFLQVTSFLFDGCSLTGVVVN